MIKLEQSLIKEFELLIGKLVRIGIIIPRSNTFIKPLQRAIYSASNGIAKFDKICINVLNLQLKIIDKSMIGTSLLRVVQYLPTLIFFTDASSKDLGGYNLQTSHTQNFKLLEGILEFTMINHLEFLAFLIQLLLAEYTINLDKEHILLWLAIVLWYAG